MHIMSRPKQFSKPFLPLTPPVFYILLSLWQKERHGYEIMKQVEKDSNNKVRLGPGTLYGAIKNMLEEKLIIEVDKGNSKRRRYYSLTDKGRNTISSEMQRYTEAVELARRVKLIKNPAKVKAALAYV
jgi:DNA-binding PadR family transcriptional regulator